MHSTTGKHYPGLDHLRALAACMVFAWHFMHGVNGYPLPFQSAPLPLLSLWDEGHTGVALFMTLSGYLFARLTDGQSIHYGWFLYNRLLRLLPLLAVTLIGYGLWESYANPDPKIYLKEFVQTLISGFIYPLWPNGAWSIAVELQFYALLPFLLALLRRSPWLLIVSLMLNLLLRIYFYIDTGEIQRLSYLTLIGRLDQFILGILAWHWRIKYAKKSYIVIFIIIFFMLLHAWFDQKGGFYGMPSYPSPSSIWIYIPTLEGFSFGLLIGWYDQFSLKINFPKKINYYLCLIGSLSYSMYLLHFFVVFTLADFIQSNFGILKNFYITLIISIICFIALLPFCWLSNKYIERPFLRYRKPYIKSR